MTKSNRKLYRAGNYEACCAHCQHGKPAPDTLTTAETTVEPAALPATTVPIAAEEQTNERKTKLFDTKTLIERGRHGVTDIYLRDENSGKETLLIEGNDDDGENWYNPYVEKVIDERFFWYGGTGYEWQTPGGVYDTHRMMKLLVEFPNDDWATYVGEHDGVRYYADEIYAEECGQLHVYPLTLSNLDTTKSLMAGENLLKDIPEADMGETYYYWQAASPDMRYFAVAEQSAVRIFDLQKKAFVRREPVNDAAVFRISFQDERTLHCYSADEYDTKHIALEIILP